MRNLLKKSKENSSSLSFFSPAKINLFFRLKSKREDGFHNLESLFQAISLGDTLSVALSKEDHFSSNVSYLSFDDHNLVIKALLVYREYTKINHPISIHLLKRIPIETGLGGGSSNGATLLWALNTLFNSNLSLEEFFLLAAKVSSDSSFFFSKGTALCKGRGEEVESLKPLDLQKGWIVKPKFGISTPKAYALAQVSNSPISLSALVQTFYTNEPQFQNDLEISACLIEPSLQKLKQELIEQGIEKVFMTGSGSGLVCLGKLPPRPKKTIQIYPFHYISRPENQWYSKQVVSHENL